MDIGSFVNIILGIAIVVNSLSQLGIDVEKMSFLIYITYIGIGVSILYSIMFILLCTAFWLQDSSWSIEFIMSLNSFADKPVSIYKGALYRFLVYLFPIGLVANIPASAILNRSDFNLDVWFIIASLLLFLLSKYIWHKGMKRYEGASI